MKTFPKGTKFAQRQSPRNIKRARGVDADVVAQYLINSRRYSRDTVILTVFDSYGDEQGFFVQLSQQAPDASYADPYYETDRYSREAVAEAVSALIGDPPENRRDIASSLETELANAPSVPEKQDNEADDEGSAGDDEYSAILRELAEDRGADWPDFAKVTEETREAVDAYVDGEIGEDELEDRIEGTFE